LYANTIYAVKVTGAELKDWLETSATRFAQIDVSKTADQALLNAGTFGYNFDAITDERVSYEIDITQPLPAMGQKASGRIKNLTFQGEPVRASQEFVVATNNYRASGGGSFPGLDGSKTVYASPESSRDVLIRYIKKTGTLTRAANGAARSFKFTPTVTAGRIVFTSAQNALPKALAAGLSNIELLQADDGSGKSLSLYAMKLAP
jgi:2',3'-cyclic-nucleotide 2'-phosphodiesterase / 3'-nucleotidase